jgi:hypothetical protein
MIYYAWGFVLHFMFVVEIILVGNKHDYLKSKLKNGKGESYKTKSKLKEQITIIHQEHKKSNTNFNSTHLK